MDSTGPTDDEPECALSAEQQQQFEAMGIPLPPLPVKSEQMAAVETDVDRLERFEALGLNMPPLPLNVPTQPRVLPPWLTQVSAPRSVSSASSVIKGFLKQHR